MDVGVIAALRERYRSEIYERALDSLGSDDTCKLYQVDVLRVVKCMPDIWAKVDSTIIHNRWSSTNIYKKEIRILKKSAQEENRILNFIEEDDCI